jgi:hypothetical protein
LKKSAHPDALIVTSFSGDISMARRTGPEIRTPSRRSQWAWVKVAAPRSARHRQEERFAEFLFSPT